jgi:hypothetical protein
MPKNAKPSASTDGGQGAENTQDQAGESTTNSAASSELSTGAPVQKSNQDESPNVGLPTDSDAQVDGMAAICQVQAVEVAAHRDGYRRAGRAWSKEPEIVLLSDLTDDQKELLANDGNMRLRGLYVTVDAEGKQV